MKKLFSFITALMVATTMFAQDALFTQTYPGNPSSYVSAYTESFTVTTDGYTLTYANINNGQASDGWDALRAGRKNNASVATITSEQLSEAISKVAINFTDVNASKTNSLKLKVADNADFTGATEVSADIAVGLIEFAIETPAANMYYQIEIDQASHSANGFNRFSSVAFYAESAGEDPGDEPGDEPAENVLTGELSGIDATYSFTYEFATTADNQLQVTGLLDITGEVVGMVPQISVNGDFANFTYEAGVCSFTSADAYEAGMVLDIYFYFAYAGGATATDHVSYTIEAQGGEEPIEEPVAYYIKNNFNGAGWAWYPMTEESEGVWVFEGVFGGSGVNVNTADNDEDAAWLPISDITCDGTLATGQTVKFIYTVASASMAAEIQDVPVVTNYYIKSKWAEDATDWTWQPMTEESEGVWVYEGSFYGTGVNINTTMDDATAVWYPLGSEFEGHQIDGDIESGQNVHFVYSVADQTVTATAIVEPVVELNTCAEVNAAAKNTEIALGAVQVIYVNGSYTYVKDATGTALLYKSNLGLTVGQLVEGIEGKVSIFKGLPELVPSNALADWTVTEGADVVYDVWTAEIAPTVAANINEIYIFEEVPYNDGAVFSDATITVYNKFNVEPAMENDHVYTFVGAISTYNGIQIMPIEVEDVTPETPVVFNHELYGSEKLPEIGKTYFATTDSWAADADSHAEIVNDYDVNVVLVNSKEAEWQSQVFVNPGFTWEVGAYYKMEFDLTTNHQLGGVHVKVNDNSEGGEFFYDSYPNDNIFLADQTTHYVADSIYAVAEPNNGGQLIFSIGWVAENTEILISNIVITKYEAPVEPQDINITANAIETPGTLIWTDAVASAGWWQIMGVTADGKYDFSISNVETTEPAGVYAIADLDEDYTYVTINGATDTVDVYFTDGSVTVAIDAEGIVTVNGSLLGEDGNTYVFALTYKDPVAEKTINVVIPAWELDDTYLAYDLFSLAGENADGDYVQLYIGSDAVAGEYTEDDLYAQYSGLIVGEEYPAIFSATIKVEEGTDGAVTVTADILCYNNTLYKVTTQASTGIEDIELVEKATKVVSNGQVFIIRDAKMFNINGARVR